MLIKQKANPVFTNLIFQNDTQCQPILREKDDSNSNNNSNTNNDN